MILFCYFTSHCKNELFQKSQDVQPKGTAALTGAIFIGPRIGRFNNSSRAVRKRGYHIPGHSVPLASLGSFILMLGFFAFNGGCAKPFVNNEHGGSIGTIFVNTMMAGSGGAMMAVATDLLYAKVFFHLLILTVYETNQYENRQMYWSLLKLINGNLAGMISICAACDRLHPDRV